jgi:hypothetical protein
MKNYGCLGVLRSNPDYKIECTNTSTYIHRAVLRAVYNSEYVSTEYRVLSTTTTTAEYMLQ